MRIIVAAAAAALFAMLPSQASAQSWYRAGGNAQTMSYVDKGSMKSVGGKTIVVTKSVYANQLSGDTGIYSVEIRAEYDCPAKVFRTLEYSYFDVNNKLMSTEPSVTINEKKVSAPGSINEAMQDFICSAKGGTLVTDPFTDAKIQMSKN